MNDITVLGWAEIDPEKDLPGHASATFIAASRELSSERIKQLIRRYLPKGDIVWGIADEAYVTGFDGQPQFKTLCVAGIEPWVLKTNDHSPHKIHVLRYSQTAISEVAKKLSARKYVFVRGSYQYAFHTQPLYRLLKERQQKFTFTSPFVDEAEAQAYAKSTKVLGLADADDLQSLEGFMRATFVAARSSYDHSFQIGAIAAKKKSSSYEYIDHAHNRVVPYETYAMHNGFSREDNKVPTQDLNHYDAVHAETLLLVRNKVQKNTALFCNVMPCRTCARAIVAAGVSEVFYNIPHAGEYTLKLFKDAGVRCERIEL